jgi:hypothetical protein
VPVLGFARKLRVPVLLLAITVAFFWKLVLSSQYTCLNSPDIVSQVIPWLQEEAVQWHSSHLPLWDTHLWGGGSLLAQVQPGALNPLNWILFSMPLKDGFIQIPILQWYWISIQFLAVLFCYWFCRDLGRSQLASILSGCAFGLGGYVAAIGWPQRMMSAVLLPLILMFFFRVLRNERPLSNAALSGALLGASFLAGHHELPTFIAVFMIGLWIYYFAAPGRPWQWRSLALPAAFFACFALIAAAQILPAYELGKLSVRWVGAANPIGWNEKVPYSVFEDFSVYPTAILGIVMPGFQRNSVIFIGVVIVALGLIGVAAKGGERMVRILTGIGIGGLFLALGARSLFHGVLYSLIPNFDKARSPSGAEAIFHLGIIVLAAYGLDALRTSRAHDAAGKFSVRILLLMAVFLYGSLIVLMTVRPPTGEEYIFLGQTALVTLLLAGILLIWRTSPHSSLSSAVLVILLLLFELNNVTTHNYLPFAAATTLQKLGENHDIAAFLKSQPNRPRVEVEEKEIPFNFGDWFGIDQIDGYQAGALKSIADVQGEWKYRALFATNYSIARSAARPDQTVAFQAQSGLKVFANPGAFPRARVVHAAVGAANEQTVIATVMNPATDLQRTVVMQGTAPQLEACDGGGVEIKRYRPAHVVMRADVACRSMVILADAWFPGWKAYVDNKPAQIYSAYNVVRGVLVDAGQHEVSLVYRPVSLYTGAVLALIGIAICVFLCFSRHGQWQTQ